MPLRSKPSWILLVVACLLLAACDLFVSAEARVNRAEAHMADGDYRAAMIELKNALQDQPENVDARLLLSRVSLQLGDLDAAKKELDRAVEAGATPERVGTLRYDVLVARREFADALTFLDADSTIGVADRLYYTSVAELGAGDIPAAREAASGLVAGFPADARGPIQSAEVLAAEGKLDDALGEVRKALELEPGNATALWTEGRLLVMAGRWEEAEKTLVVATGEGAARLDATTRAAALAALTEAHLGQQDVESATASFAELEAIAPGAVGTRMLKARLALLGDQPADAVDQLQPVVQALPDYVPGQLLMGAALIQNRSCEQAESLLARAVARAPDNVEARRLLARAQLCLNRADSAGETLSMLDTLEGDPQTDWLRGQALLRSGNRGDAIELLERSAASEPDNPRLQTELARAYLEAGRTNEAVTLLERLPQGAADGQRDSLLVLAYATQGDKERSRTEVEKLAKEHADDATILSLVGNYMLRTGDVDTARSYFQQATRVSPDEAAPWLSLSGLEYRLGNRDAARAALLKAQGVDPDNEAAALGLARIELDQNATTGAVEVLDRVVAANAGAMRARLLLGQLNLRLGNEGRARELFDEVVNKAPNRDEALLAVGGAELRAGQTDAAIATFRKAVAQKPDNPDALYALGAAQVAQKDVAAGRRNLETALEHRPDWVQPAMLLTMLDVQAGRVDEALERARATRTANPGNVTAIALEADVLAAAGRIDDALQAYADAQAVRATRQVAQRMVQLRAGRGDGTPEQPLADFIAGHPDDIIARRLLAEHYQAAGERPQAISEYEKLISIAPRDAASTNNLAWLYYEVKDPRAESTARRAVEISPDNGAILDTLGWVLVEKGQCDDGVKVLRRAVDHAPTLRDARYHLAAGLARCGKRDEARTMLMELLGEQTSFPSRPQAETLLKELGQ